MFRQEKIISLLALVLFSGWIGLRSQTKKSFGVSLPTLTVCGALSHANQYDGKLVRIRGRVLSTGEATGFVSEDCPGVLVTDGRIWQSAIAWTMPTDRMFIVHPVNFKYDWDSSKRLKAKYHRLHKHLPDECIELTYTGMFEVWSVTNSKKTDSKGTPYEIPGFGHLNGAGAQLVLKSADDAMPIPNCKKKQSGSLGFNKQMF